MSSSYPGALDSFSTKTNFSEEIDSSHINGLQDSVVAIETTLGVNPQGSYSDLVTRLDSTIVPVNRGNLTESTSSVLTITGGSSAVVGSGTTITVTQASSGDDGYLSSADWSTFNGKQSSLTTTNSIDIIVASIAFGDPTVEGTWKLVPDGNNLVAQRRDANGDWIEQGGFYLS